jgi:hypothetical protein
MVAANPQKLMGSTKTVQSAVIQPQQQLIAAPADTAALQDISKSLARITQLLTQQNSQVTAEANQERKNQENAKRKKVELGLENSFAAVKNVAQAVVSPVKNILDQIIQFFVTLFLGKAILNLIDWFSKEENQSKIRSIARFLKDWWPSLVAGYILFGTGFGRVVRNLAGIGLSAVKGLGGITLKLIGAIAKATGFKKAGALMSGLGGGGGLKGLAARLLTGAAVAGGTALVANKMMGGGDAPQVAVPEPATLPTAEAFGGGLIDFKTMLAASGGQVDSKLGIFAQLFGSGGFAGLLNSVPGVVSGPKGIDKVPAMLTDGEFVMSRGAVQKFGVSNLEAMNAAGGGTNKPKIVQKRIYAEGGGLMGDDARRKYDAEKGAGAYDAESARRRESLSQQDAAQEAKKNKKPVYVQSDYVRQLKERAQTQGTTSTLSVNGMRIPGGGALSQQLQGMQSSKLTAPKVNANIDPNAVVRSIQSGIISTYKKLGAKTTTDQQLNAEFNKKALEKQRPWWDKAGLFGGGSRVVQNETAARNKQDQENKRKQQIRDEYHKIQDNMDHPLYEQANFGDLTLDKFKQQYQSPAAAATPAATPAAVGPRFADLRGSATPGSSTPASGVKPSGGGMFQPGGLFGGPSNAARSGYAASKGKYYSSSDQKTYGSENDALAAKKSRMTSLASQQRLNKLSFAGANRSSRGVRIDAQDKERGEEFKERGGLMGQFGRLGQRMFGGAEAQKKLDMQQKASDARVKQAGASSIGRYYSSSDGKYYANFAAADKARIARKAKLGATPVKGKPITPTPKPAPKVYNPAGGAMGGRRGGSGGGSKGTGIPSIPPGKDNRKTANQLNIK